MHTTLMVIQLTFYLQRLYNIYQKDGALTSTYMVLEMLKLDEKLGSYGNFSKGQLKVNGL